VERSGKYVCVISNNYGSLKKTIQLKVGKNKKTQSHLKKQNPNY